MPICTNSTILPGVIRRRRFSLSLVSDACLALVRPQNFKMELITHFLPQHLLPTIPTFVAEDENKISTCSNTWLCGFNKFVDKACLLLEMYSSNT